MILEMRDYIQGRAMSNAKMFDLTESFPMALGEIPSNKTTGFKKEDLGFFDELQGVGKTWGCN